MAPWLMDDVEQAANHESTTDHFAQLERGVAELSRHLLDRHHRDVMGYLQPDSRDSADSTRQSSLRLVGRHLAIVKIREADLSAGHGCPTRQTSSFRSERTDHYALSI